MPPSCPCGQPIDDGASAAVGLCRRCDRKMQDGQPYGLALRPKPGLRIEKATIRRDARRPELAEGERLQIELDPEQLRRMFKAGEGFLRELHRLARGGKRRPRRPR